MPIEITLTDNSNIVREEFERLADKALETCGLIAEGYAKNNIVQLNIVDTGNLLNSITHEVTEDSGGKAAIIGTNVPYAAYPELGTGKYATGGGGSAPWVYPVETAEGVKFYRTEGQQARPYLKPAIADHEGQYHSIIEKTMKEG